MAKLEKVIDGDFDALLARIERGLLEGSVSAAPEDSSDFQEGGARCSVRVFERFSYTGANRLSMNLTLFQGGGGPVHLSAVTAGGGRVPLVKTGAGGEEAFLDKLRKLL